MAELKPCPFCGGAKMDVSQKVVARDHGTKVQYRVAVYCKSCNTYGPRVLTEKIKVYSEQRVDFEKARESAIEAWNRRAGDGK